MFSRRDLKHPCRKQQVYFFKVRMLVTLWLGPPILSLNQNNETTLQFHLQKKILQDKENKPAHGILTFKPCLKNVSLTWSSNLVVNYVLWGTPLESDRIICTVIAKTELSGSSWGLCYPLSFCYSSYSVTLFPQLVSFHLQAFKQIFMYVWCFACLYVCVHSCSTHRGRKRAPDPLELKLQTVWGALWVLRRETRSSDVQWGP